MNLPNLQTLLISLPAVLICLTVHEFAHGFIADKLGDPTARLQGRRSLNPLRHIDPIGFICLLLFHFGWAKPVPVNPMNFKKPKRDMALTALAGPLSNIILAFVFILVSTLGGTICFYMGVMNNVFNALFSFLLITASMSVGLAVFNLIPIPPLDGSNILLSFLPNKWVYTFQKYSSYIQIALLVLLFFGFLDVPLIWLRNLIWDPLISLTSLIVGLFF